MKKFILGAMLLLSALCLSFRTQVARADGISFNTLYPDNIVEYENLEGISDMSVSENFVAYTLNKTDLITLNMTTRQKLVTTGFENIKDIKLVNSTQAIVVDYNEGSHSGKIYVVTISDNETTKESIDKIDISNLKAIDIYNDVSSDRVLIGYIRSDSPDGDSAMFYLHEIKNNPNLDIQTSKYTVTPYTNTLFNKAYLLTLSSNNYYVVFKNESSKARIFSKTYNSEATDDQTSTETLENMKLLDYYNFENKEYLVAYTQENLYLINTITFAEINFLDKQNNIVDIDVFENKIYASNTTAKLIETYNIDETESPTLQKCDALLSSSNDNLGRFNNASDIFIQGKEIFVSDSSNDRIEIIDGTTPYQISDLEVDSNPTGILLDKSQNLYFVEKSNSNSLLIKYKSTNEHEYEKVSTFSVYNNNTHLGAVSDTTISNDNTVYLIDYTNKNLIFLSPNGLQIKSSIASLEPTKDTKIEYLKGLNQLVIYSNNNLYLLDITSGSTLNTIQLENVKDITSDINNIYALVDNKINLITILNSTMQISEKSLENDHFKSYSTITFDNLNSKMYAFETGRQCIEYFDISLVEKPYKFSDVSESTALNKDSKPLALQIKNDAIIYDEPYSIGNNYRNISTCIGLEKYQNFYRVLFNYNDTLKVGFISDENVNIVPHDTDRSIRVLTTNQQVPVYKYPTILKYNNSAIITSHISIDTYIYITYNSFPITIDEKQFYLYQKDDTIGYIFNADVVLDEEQNITYLNNNNATVSAIGVDEVIIYSDESEGTPVGSLHNGDRIYVESFDKHKEYTKIIYKDEELNTIEGYVRTEYIEMDKLDNTKIILILIIVASIVILVIATISYIVIKKKRS